MIEIDPTIIANAKRALHEAASSLPEIKGRNGLFTYGKTTDLLLEHPDVGTVIDNLPERYTRDSRLASYVKTIVMSAFDYQGEEPPLALMADIGVVGETGQQLDYLHTDPNLHISWKLGSGDENPSTLVTAPKTMLDFMNIEGFWRTTTAEVPAEYYGNPVPEGNGTVIHPGVYHGERTLPPGTALLSIFAAYK